ncbi:hypothetical protein GC098_28715 [Paenibacillus sp. LMG 31458]|uniref:Uncharacterized protein n=1 Tax=Paenibacillus phytorum TaxID=2654977 RepID=A0ABX1Y508_9BACL|nr:hypothetical protein [Paenibacillus phytorum]NOU75321.1 hypothetical protein [Paenibacillus phytorum]
MSMEGVKEFIVNGSYVRLKHEMEKLIHLKDQIREEQDNLNLKRIEWTDVGVVGEFTTNKRYRYNHKELKIFLFDLGILPLVATFIECTDLTDTEIEMVGKLQIPGEKYLHYSPNKLGKYKEDEIIGQVAPSVETTLTEKVSLWKETYLKFEVLNKMWEKQRKNALADQELILSKKVSFEYGTISLQETSEKYRVKDLFELLNNERLLEVAKIDLAKIIEFTARGLIKISELNKYRGVIDVQRKYILMTLQKEKQKRYYWDRRLEILSKLSL